MFRTYYQLTKPGIIYGNDLSAIAGFFLASNGHFNLVVFLGMLIGISLVIASACVFNNYIDREIDAKMARTQKRALVQGIIATRNALVYATVLGATGIATLFKYTNTLTVILALMGMFVYIVLYGYFKRHSVYGTLVGSISGSMPLVVGYCAVTNRFDMGAVLLFIIMALWQMPHFYSLAIYRQDEYKEAELPVLPVVQGVPTAKKHIVFYTSLFFVAVLSLSYFKYTGITYLVIMGTLGIFWIYYGVKGLHITNSDQWARKMFRLSLVVLLIFSLMLCINSFVP